MVAPRESADLAAELISQTCARQNVNPNRLIIHSDRGAAMTSQTVAQLLAELGVLKSLSRPHVSNDNAFSESQFKTLKYCPPFPEKFGSIEDATTFLRWFFEWYNNEHRHSGIALMTPSTVHYGLAADCDLVRTAVLSNAYREHPERFVKGQPKPPELPEAAWINPPTKESKKEAQPAA
jgi:putative transposase